MSNRKLQKRNMINKRCLVLSVYIIAIIILVVVKFHGSIMDVINNIHSIEWDRSMGVWNINLIPFNTITAQLERSDELVAVINLFANIVLFVPLGFLLPWTFQSIVHFWQVILFSTIFIGICELSQLIFKLGSCDIDDLILNLIGASIGYLGYKCFMKYWGNTAP